MNACPKGPLSNHGSGIAGIILGFEIKKFDKKIDILVKNIWKFSRKLVGVWWLRLKGGAAKCGLVSLVLKIDFTFIHFAAVVETFKIFRIR